MTTQSLKAEAVALEADVMALDAEAKALNDKLESLDLAGRLALIAGLEGRAVFTT
ncbi:phosphoadenosine phosphosulfate reductase, partial [Sinorhizobium meliloti]